MSQDNLRADQIAAKLTPAMREGLISATHGRGRSSCTMRVSLGTCEALAARGLVRRVAKHGAFYSPRTAIYWPLTRLGDAVRAILLEQSK